MAGVRNDPWSKYVVSVNQIEALTGYHFFSALAPAVAAALKSKVDGQPTPMIAVSASVPISPQTTQHASQQPLWIPIAIVVLAMVLVLTIGVLIVFFKTRPKRYQSDCLRSLP